MVICNLISTDTKQLIIFQGIAQNITGFSVKNYLMEVLCSSVCLCDFCVMLWWQLGADVLPVTKSNQPHTSVVKPMLYWGPLVILIFMVRSKIFICQRCMKWLHGTTIWCPNGNLSSGTFWEQRRWQSTILGPIGVFAVLYFFLLASKLTLYGSRAINIIYGLSSAF